MHYRSLYRLLIWIQGVYTLLTALWGLVDIDSFMAVTGPKTDIWLVKTVSVLLLPVVLVLFSGLQERMPLWPVAFCGGLTALGLACVEYYYAAERRISW